MESYKCEKCNKSFTRTYNLFRHQKESCVERFVNVIEEKRRKVDGVASSSAMQSCKLCSICVPKNQMLAHQRTLQHKSKSCVPVCDGVQLVQSSFKHRIATYYVSSENEHVDYAVFFEEIKPKVLRLISDVLQVQQSLKINMVVVGRYFLPTQDVVSEKSFNTCNEIVTEGSNLEEVYQSFVEAMKVQSSEFQEKDSVITTKVRGYAHCSADELMRCAKPLSVLDSGLTLVSTKADLEKVCPDLREAVSCIHRYTRYCMSREDRSHFKKLFHGTAEMVQNLCRNETYQEEFLKYAPCMQTVEPQNEVCFKQYTKKINEIESKTPMEGITEEDLIAFKTSLKRKRDAADEGIKNVCCSFQEYVECSTSTTRSVCGNEAADFSKMFLDKMSSSMLQLHCQNYGPRECGLVTSSSKKLDTSILPLLVVTLLSILVR